MEGRGALRSETTVQRRYSSVEPKALKPSLLFGPASRSSRASQRPPPICPRSGKIRGMPVKFSHPPPLTLPEGGRTKLSGRFQSNFEFPWLTRPTHDSCCGTAKVYGKMIKADSITRRPNRSSRGAGCVTIAKYDEDRTCVCARLSLERGGKAMGWREIIVRSLLLDCLAISLYTPMPTAQT
jgi:hypothetical protein